MLLQSELNGDVAHFTTQKSNLSCNKSGCCWLQNIVTESREKFYFWQQNLYMLCILPAQGKLVLQQVMRILCKA